RTRNVGTKARVRPTKFSVLIPTANFVVATSARSWFYCVGTSRQAAFLRKSYRTSGGGIARARMHNCRSACGLLFVGFSRLRFRATNGVPGDTHQRVAFIVA